MQQRNLDFFTAGCPLCVEALQQIRRLADETWHVRVYDMETGDAFAKAREYGVKQVPTVVIDGRVAPCCRSEGLSESFLRDLLRAPTA